MMSNVSHWSYWYDWMITNMPVRLPIDTNDWDKLIMPVWSYDHVWNNRSYDRMLSALFGLGLSLSLAAACSTLSPASASVLLTWSWRSATCAGHTVSLALRSCSPLLLSALALRSCSPLLLSALSGSGGSLWAQGSSLAWGSWLCLTRSSL
jgi:hypothetical protein